MLVYLYFERNMMSPDYSKLIGSGGNIAIYSISVNVAKR